MHPHRLISILTCLSILESYVTPFKTIRQYQEALKNADSLKFTKTDTVVGKAIEFVNSDKTFMNLLAGEMWNFGSSAIDRIVDYGSGNKSKKPAIDFSNFPGQESTLKVKDPVPKLKKYLERQSQLVPDVKSFDKVQETLESKQPLTVS